MKKVKAGILVLVALVVANFCKAQTIEEGKTLLYYEKYISAKNLFQKLVDVNPNNTDAVYWLGQTLLAPDDDKDISGAEALYQKALMANSNSPLLIAGMGHVRLLQGNTADARNQFETAISLSQGKNIAVLNAIGSANADFFSKSGDGGYAVEKLKQAIALKGGAKDPELLSNLGDAYRKFSDGGNAQLSYEAALAAVPNYARAKYRIGRIYQTQGPQQFDIFMKYYNEAIAMDPNYTPVYWTLFQYFYENNVTKSAEYLEKYLTAKGADEPNSCFLRAQMKYAQGLFQDAITKSDECIAAAGGNPYPNLFGVKAYSAFKLGDSVNAKTNFDLYFQKQKPAKIGPTDLLTYAIVLLKFPGNESLAGTYIDKAVTLDTTENDKVAHLKLIAAIYEARKQYKDAADWYKKIVMVRAIPTRTDIFNAGYNYYRSGDPQTAITMFNVFTQKYPDDILGYYWVAKPSWVIDSTMELGMANPSFAKVIQLGEATADKSKIKTQLMTAYKYMIAYYANIAKNKDSALNYIDRAIALDPTDQENINNKDVISKMNMNAPPPKGSHTVTNSKGDKVTTDPDGTITTVSHDGSTNIVTRSGKVTTIKDGVTKIVEGGKVTTIGKDGITTIVEGGKITTLGKDGKPIIVQPPTKPGGQNP